ncbi:uncharacterized protein J4E78_010858 [Alternaria triticimaculans]|uniref:uncharacterized protein n=1 Tax=Alternaria triticimaculans TaxID=297637 RepID=UPI0020C5955B|nr:uncharacterized protein J4E78_010858 [Alternaria triticimaculans]KAI4639531.1 hypothetical protein J4E78_010858 [Alternaria triticimaculans]
MSPKEKTEFGLSLREENRRKRQRQQNDSNDNDNEVPVAPTTPAASAAPATSATSAAPAALHVAPNQEEEVPVEPAAEIGEGEEVSDHPARPHDDVHDNEAGPPVANELPPPSRSDADAPAAASGPRLRLRLPAGGAAPPTPAAIPPTILTDHQREMAAVTTNWGPDYRTLRDCIKANTWFKGSIVNLTEETCEIETLRKLRELSDKTPNDGAKMKEQMDFHWRQRDKQGRVGGTKLEKQENLREDLQLLIDGKRMKEGDIQTYKGRPKDDGDASARKRNDNGRTPDASTKRVRKTPQDDDDESSSEDSTIPRNGLATAPKGKGKGKERATEVTSDDTEVIPLTRRQRDEALGRIYDNWELTSDQPLTQFLPGLLLPPDMTDDSLIDGRILARIRDLSNVTRGQALFVREALASAMNDFVGENVEQVLDLLAQVRAQLQEAMRVLDRASEEARAREQAEGPSRGALIPGLGVAGPSAPSSSAVTMPRPPQPLQASTQPAAQPGLSRFEGGVLTIGTNWTLRRALNDSRQADQGIQTARRRYEQAVLNGQSAIDQAALLLGMEVARGVSNEAYARTDELQGRWVDARSRRSTMGDGLGGLTSDSRMGHGAQAKGTKEGENEEQEQEENGGEDGGENGEGSSGGNGGEGRVTRQSKRNEKEKK